MCVFSKLKILMRQDGEGEEEDIYENKFGIYLMKRILPSRALPAEVRVDLSLIKYYGILFFVEILVP